MWVSNLETNEIHTNKHKMFCVLRQTHYWDGNVILSFASLCFSLGTRKCQSQNTAFSHWEKASQHCPGTTQSWSHEEVPSRESWSSERWTFPSRFLNITPLPCVMWFWVRHLLIRMWGVSGLSVIRFSVSWPDWWTLKILVLPGREHFEIGLFLSCIPVLVIYSGIYPFVRDTVMS